MAISSFSLYLLSAHRAHHRPRFVFLSLRRVDHLRPIAQYRARIRTYQPMHGHIRVYERATKRVHARRLGVTVVAHDSRRRSQAESRKIIPHHRRLDRPSHARFARSFFLSRHPARAREFKLHDPALDLFAPRFHFLRPVHGGDGRSYRRWRTPRSRARPRRSVGASVVFAASRSSVHRPGARSRAPCASSASPCDAARSGSFRTVASSSRVVVARVVESIESDLNTTTSRRGATRDARRRRRARRLVRPHFPTMGSRTTTDTPNAAGCITTPMNNWLTPRTRRTETTQAACPCARPPATTAPGASGFGT